MFVGKPMIPYWGDMMAEAFIIIVFMIPFYGMLLWVYFCPEESILFGRKWMYKEEPEITGEAIQYTKFTSITLMVGTAIVLISLIFENYFLRLSLVLLPVVLVLGALKIFSSN